MNFEQKKERQEIRPSFRSMINKTDLIYHSDTIINAVNTICKIIELKGLVN